MVEQLAKPQSMTTFRFDTVLLKLSNNSKSLESNSENNDPIDLVKKFVKPTKPRKVKPSHAGGVVPGDEPTIEDYYTITKLGTTKYKGEYT